MSTFEIRNPDYEAAVRARFAQPFMTLIGAELVSVQPGTVELRLPFRSDLAQQTGVLHAGVIAAIADTAAGLAALTLMAPGSEVMSVEFKLNLLAPGSGPEFIARGRVLRPGRTITACITDVYNTDDASEKLIATMLATMIGLRT